MQKPHIVCRPTAWFYGRMVLLALMLAGFGGYFWYDAAIGYPQKNREYHTHKIFVAAGSTVDKMRANHTFNKENWNEYAQGVLNYKLGFKRYPLAEIPKDGSATPTELLNFELMSKSWNEAWQAYSSRVRYDFKPIDEPMGYGKITEQIIGSCVCFTLAFFVIFIVIRTSRRTLTIDGESITAAGKTFKIEQIKLIDLRNWKLKGLAKANVQRKGKSFSVRIDGMTYGQFESDNPNSAENFMQALLSQYKGDILDFSDESESTKS